MRRRSRLFEREVGRLGSDMKIPPERSGKIDRIGGFDLQRCPIDNTRDDPLPFDGSDLPPGQLNHQSGTELPVVLGPCRKIAEGHD